MASDIVIPKLGMTMAEAKVAEWRVKEGEWVKEKQIVLVIETDKVTFEVEALSGGFLHILVGPGTVAAVGAVVGKLAETQEELARLQSEQPTPAMAAVEGVTVHEAGPAAADRTEEMPGKRVKASPAAKKMAEVHDLDLSAIAGTGPGGRIVTEDVEKALAARTAGVAPTAAAPAAKAPAGVTSGAEMIDGKRVKVSIPMEGMRKVIAEHMERSLKVSAQLTTIAEMDAGELIRVRESFLLREKQIGLRISYTDILVFVLARALRDVPIVNSSLIDGQIKIWEDVNIGVAASIQTDEYSSGLVVPVVRNAERKSLLDIARAIKGLTERARSGKLLPDDLTGGTFTLSNVGVFGEVWSVSTPIINQPQAAILLTGAIVERPVVRNGQILARPIMPVSLTFDHRILDGAPVGKFVSRLKDLVENLHLMFV